MTIWSDITCVTFYTCDPYGGMHSNQIFTDTGGNFVPDSSGTWTSIRESLGDAGELKAKGVPGKLEITQLSEATWIIQSRFRWSSWEVGSSFSEALDSAEPDRV